MRSASVVFDDYPKNLTTVDNTHKCRLGKRTYPRVVFEPDMLFQGKKDPFLRKTANKHRVFNVISTELRKEGCYAFQSYDNADLDIINLVDKSSLKCLMTNWGEQKLTCAIVVSIRR